MILNSAFSFTPRQPCHQCPVVWMLCVLTSHFPIWKKCTRVLLLQAHEMPVNKTRKVKYLSTISFGSKNVWEEERKKAARKKCMRTTYSLLFFCVGAKQQWQTHWSQTIRRRKNEDSLRIKRNARLCSTLMCWAIVPCYLLRTIKSSTIFSSNWNGICGLTNSTWCWWFRRGRCDLFSCSYLKKILVKLIIMEEALGVDGKGDGNIAECWTSHVMESDGRWVSPSLHPLSPNLIT